MSTPSQKQVEAFGRMAGLAYNGEVIHVGLLNGENITGKENDLAALAALELNPASYSRPSGTISGAGAYNSGTGRWELPPVEFTITAPTGGLTFDQFFFVIDGNATTQDATGTVEDVATEASPITLSAGNSVIVTYNPFFVVP